MLPRSFFSTPGMRGLGDAGSVPDDDKEYAGLQIVYVARTAATCMMRTPCFGFVTSTVKKTALRRT